MRQNWYVERVNKYGLMRRRIQGLVAATSHLLKQSCPSSRRLPEAERCEIEIRDMNQYDHLDRKSKPRGNPWETLWNLEKREPVRQLMHLLVVKGVLASAVVNIGPSAEMKSGPKH